MNIKKQRHGNQWLYNHKNITLISDVELPVQDGKDMVGPLNPHRVSIAYDFPAQDSPVRISAQKGVFSHVTVGDLDIKGYSVEDYIRAAADRLFRNID